MVGTISAAPSHQPGGLRLPPQGREVGGQPVPVVLQVPRPLGPGLVPVARAHDLPSPAPPGKPAPSAWPPDMVPGWPQGRSPYRCPWSQARGGGVRDADSLKSGLGHRRLSSGPQLSRPHKPPASPPARKEGRDGSGVAGSWGCEGLLTPRDCTSIQLLGAGRLVEAAVGEPGPSAATLPLRAGSRSGAWRRRQRGGVPLPRPRLPRRPPRPLFPERQGPKPRRLPSPCPAEASDAQNSWTAGQMDLPLLPTSQGEQGHLPTATLSHGTAWDGCHVASSSCAGGAVG